MFRKVRISAENHKFSASVMLIMRTIGLFPISAHRDKLGTYLQLSPFYLLYSFGLGLFSIVHASIGLFEDILPPDGVSIRIRTSTDAFVELFDWGIVHVVAACGFFVIPSKFRLYFRYIKSIEEVDAVLHVKHTTWEKHMQTIVCLVTLSAMTYQVVLDYFTYVYLMQDISPLIILKRYGCNYFGCVIMMMTEFEFQHMGTDLSKRIRKFNVVLETANKAPLKSKFAQKVDKLKMTVYCSTKLYQGKEKKGKYGKKVLPKYNVQSNMTWGNEKLYGERIDKLMKIYLKLCDVLAVQNELLTITGVCAITATFFHLIEALYFLLSDLTEPFPLWYVMQISWLIIHIVRFILVIEPYYGIFVEFETTKALVCKLQSLRVGEHIFKKLRLFTLILGLRSTKFSLSGATDIDRTMFTAIMGYATTYLVILLQYSDSDNGETQM